MSNENQNKRKLIKLGVPEIILLVLVGLYFLFSFIDNIIWKVNFIDYVMLIINTAFVLFLGAGYLFGERKGNSLMKLVAMTFVLFVVNMNFPQMGQNETLGELSMVVSLLIYFMIIFLVALTFLSFVLDNKFTQKTPRIMEYIVAPLFVIYTLIYFIYTLAYAFRDYSPAPTFAMWLLANVFLLVYFSILFVLPLFPLLSGYLKKQSPKKEAEFVTKEGGNAEQEVLKEKGEESVQDEKEVVIEEETPPTEEPLEPENE